MEEKPRQSPRKVRSQRSDIGVQRVLCLPPSCLSVLKSPCASRRGFASRMGTGASNCLIQESRTQNWFEWNEYCGRLETFCDRRESHIWTSECTSVTVYPPTCSFPNPLLSSSFYLSLRLFIMSFLGRGSAPAGGVNPERVEMAMQECVSTSLYISVQLELTVTQT